MIFQFSKNNKIKFFFSMEFHFNWLLKSSCFELFGGRKYGLFLNQEVHGKIILLIIEKTSCFELFRDGKYGLFFSEKVHGKMILTDYWNLLFWFFQKWKIRSFFKAKSWWKYDVYFVFLSFPWYSRTWEIWFFMQWNEIKSTYNGRGIAFDGEGSWSFGNNFAGNIVIFGADNSSSSS